MYVNFPSCLTVFFQAKSIAKGIGRFFKQVEPSTEEKRPEAKNSSTSATDIVGERCEGLNSFDSTAEMPKRTHLQLETPAVKSERATVAVVSPQRASSHNVTSAPSPAKRAKLAQEAADIASGKQKQLSSFFSKHSKQ